jgi:hypothetical protein
MLVRLALVVLVCALLWAKIRRHREAVAKTDKGRVVLLSNPRAASATKAVDAGP